MSIGVAKVFKNGQSQAIRLPKEFRVDADEVFISRDGDNLIIFPKPKMTWEKFFMEHEACPEFELDRPDNVPPQERDLF
jgi:antitoxin VapB